MIARTTPWGTIQIGEEFHFLSKLEQDAVLAHERGHIHHRHALKRVWWFVTLKAFFRTDAFFAMCEAQELEADQYAVNQGHRTGLLNVLIALSKAHKHDTQLAKRMRVIYG